MIKDSHYKTRIIWNCIRLFLSGVPQENNENINLIKHMFDNQRYFS